MKGEEKLDMGEVGNKIKVCIHNAYRIQYEVATETS